MKRRELDKSQITIIIVTIVVVLALSIGIIYWQFGDLFIKRDNSNNTNKPTNVTNDKDNYITEINGFKVEFPNVISEVIKKKDGTETGYVVCLLDEGHYNAFKSVLCVGNTEKYYSLETKEYSKSYDEVYAINDSFINAGYIDSENIEYYVDILDINSGKVIKTLNAVSIKEEKIGSKIKYKSADSLGDSCYTLLDENFEKVLGDNSAYAYDVNSNNTITIISGNTFIVFDFDGKKLYQSKKYTEVIEVGPDFLIVNDNGKINAISKEEKLITNITILEGKWYSSQTDGARNCYSDGHCEPIYMVRDDDIITIEYNWKNNTFRIEKNK